MLQLGHAAAKTPPGEQRALGTPPNAQYHWWNIASFAWVTFVFGGPMTNKRNIGTVAALGGLTAAVALITALPSARADELGDLRANQELLQRRIDQLAQVPPPGAPPGGPGGPVMAGSFPRSFVVPGTEVSLRVGGQGVGTVVWYMKGSAVGGALNGQGSFNETYVDGQGGTGN